MPTSEQYPLRSLLFCPATSERPMKKLPTIGADAVAIDLEDAVTDDLKEGARELVYRELDRFAEQRTYVRVNPLHTGRTMGDILAIVHPNLDGLVVPKVRDADQVRQVDAWLSAAEEQRGLEVGKTKLLLLIESAKGVHRATEIMSASERVETAIFGFVDYMLDVGIDTIDHSPGAEELLYARSRLVASAREAGRRQPLDGPYINIKNDKEFFEQVRQARRLGFAGKMLIHPNQVPLTHEAFKPDAREVELAETIISEFEKAEADGVAAIAVNGQLVDYPVYQRAQRIVEAAK